LSTWAIVPVKPFSEGKSRLRSCFQNEELFEINKNCFIRTLKKLQDNAEIDHVLVISRSQEVLEIAQAMNAEALLESEPFSLNNGIKQALLHLGDKLCSRVMIIPTDLPRLDGADLKALLTRPLEWQGVVLVPDHLQTGTNAVVLCNTNSFLPQFGRNSFQKHARQALKIGENLDVLLIENIQHDLDTYTDLEMLDKKTLNQLKQKE